MRITQIVLLRLFVDTEDSAALRGTVRSLTNDTEHPFSDGETLLAMLHQICMDVASTTRTNGSAQEGD